MKRERITREELMERLFHDDYENLKGKKLRMTRVRVPGKEVCFPRCKTQKSDRLSCVILTFMSSNM